MSSHVKFYCRGNQGIWRVNGTSEPYSKDASFSGDSSKDCSCLEFSPAGDRLAWSNGRALNIYDTVNDKLLHSIECASLSFMLFSPKSSTLATWQVYSTGKDKQPRPNMFIYNVESGQQVASYIQKKAQLWHPQWSVDEEICARNVNNELRFHEKNNFDEIKTKLHLQKVAQYSLAKCKPPYAVAAYVPGVKGLPSNIRIYRYPNFGGHSAAIASKSFFKADRATLEWNSLGTAMLILTSTESSDSSYYGEQGLHFLAVNGDSCVVPLNKNGPVYNIAWHPSGTEFTVLYGYMPAKCTIFNMKNDVVFDFGTGPRNQLFYNPFGNILCLAGFGNLQGNLEFWDVEAKKLISSVSAKDATCFLWSADGCHALTATLSPRIRVGNGYKIWHYTGSLMKQETLSANMELWQAEWSPVPAGTFAPPTISYTPIETKEKVPATNAAPAYRPPGARGKAAITKIHEYEPPSNQKKPAEDVASAAPLSKNQKRKRAKAAAKEASDAALPETAKVAPSPAAPTTPASVSLPPSNSSGASNSTARYVELTGDPEKDKRIKNLSKKLQQIQKLREDQASGVVLQNNQLVKLQKEDEIIEELESLSFG
ncbi:eukaryotic translation initiation factor 2A-like [Watersipora subatra]|uniref:eukaryotic translation initiation factor 2A-like n=1 Tax=Watersipora subatra TaxID=2589382 RepID=UPI00355BDD8B